MIVVRFPSNGRDLERKLSTGRYGCRVVSLSWSYESCCLWSCIAGIHTRKLLHIKCVCVAKNSRRCTWCGQHKINFVIQHPAVRVARGAKKSMPDSNENLCCLVKDFQFNVVQVGRMPNSSTYLRHESGCHCLQ
jgi:hypothetical protein